jgi:hypothetical protein
MNNWATFLRGIWRILSIPRCNTRGSINSADANSACHSAENRSNSYSCSLCGRQRTAAQVEDAKGSKKRKFRRHHSDYCSDCGQDDHTWSSDACYIQALMRVRSKREGRMKSLLIPMPKGSAVLCAAEDGTSVDIICRWFS